MATIASDKEERDIDNDEEESMLIVEKIKYLIDKVVALIWLELLISDSFMQIKIIYHSLRLECMAVDPLCFFAFAFWKHLQEWERYNVLERSVRDKERDANNLEFWDILGANGVNLFLSSFYVSYKWVFLCI